MANPIRSALFAKVFGTSTYAPVSVGQTNELLISNGGGASALNLSANTVVKNGAGRICRVNVTTAGSAAGAIYDTNVIANAAAANLVATIPNTVGSYTFDFPVATGIVYTPGSGQVVSVSYL